MKNPFINIADFTCGYPGGFHLKPVSFSINRGSITGIIGPNGCGKTTLFRGISGDIKNSGGKISFDNQDLLEAPRKEKARLMAIVTQESESLGISVEDYVLLGRIPHQKPWQFFDSVADLQIARHYMELTGVVNKRDEKMDHLSGGEKQLAAIARALTQEPILLLLDEPTASLDISHQVQILNLLQELKEEMGLTVLLVIHDLNLASEYCDYLVLISQGAIHTQGTPEQVLTYQNIEDVYQTLVVTKPHPISGKPAVFLVTGQTQQTNGGKTLRNQ